MTKGDYALMQMLQELKEILHSDIIDASLKNSQLPSTENGCRKLVSKLNKQGWVDINSGKRPHTIKLSKQAETINWKEMG